MQTIFPFIKIEGKKYPSVIMGEDKFSGWFNNQIKYNSEKERADAYRETIEAAYSRGVRGFSMSPHETLMNVLIEFKKKYPNIVCIANHHYRSHYKIGDESLWKAENIERLISSAACYLGKDKAGRCAWFKNTDITKIFSKEEIGLINLDEFEYRNKLREFKKFCDFFIVGNIAQNSLVIIGREDMLKREISLVREEGLIPLGICESGGLFFSKIESLDVAGTWVRINQNFVCPSLRHTLTIFSRSTKPITAYKILESKGRFNLEKSMKFIKKLKQIKTIVIGVENKMQAEETFTELGNIFSR